MKNLNAACNPNTPQEVLAALAGDTDGDVRVAVEKQNPKTSSGKSA